MPETLLTPDRMVLVGDTLNPVLCRAHDAWMAEGDRLLGPVTDPNATFWQRWSAVRYMKDLFQPRLQLEKRLVDELHAFLTPELNVRLAMQADRLERLYRDLDLLADRRCIARQMGRTAQELLEALRLWYAEIEFAVGEIRQSELSRPAIQLLDRIRAGQPADWYCLC